MSAGAQEADAWFTVMGDPADASVNTVQLNLADLPPRGEIRTMALRVTLAKANTTSRGEHFSSYVSRIAIGCEKDSIVHVEQTRFPQPRWQGASTFQRFTEMRPMAFAGFDPSPKASILRAACQAKSR